MPRSPQPLSPLRAEAHAEAESLGAQDLAEANLAAAELAARRRLALHTAPTEVWSNAMATAVGQLHGGVRGTLLAASQPGTPHGRTVRGLLLAQPHR